jgi:multiple sugar transport system substrate-binding protein
LTISSITIKYFQTRRSMKRIGLFLLLLLLLSCGKKDGTKVKLTFWQFWTNPEVKPAINELIQKFEKENPQIKVEVTDLTWADGHEKIVVSFGSNSAPDVLELGSDWIPEFSSQGVLQDITSEAEKIEANYLMWEPATYYTRIFGFPWLVDTRVLFYNKELMEKAGLNPEFPPKTWQEFLEACQKINQLKPRAYGFGANSAERHRLYKKFLPFFWGNGGKVLNAEGSECLVNSKEGIEALEFYKKLVQAGTIENQRMLDEAFMQGKIGFLISGGWFLKDIKKNSPQLSFGAALIPKPAENKGISSSFAGGEFLVINKKTKNLEQAKKFVEFMIKAENSLKLCQAIGSSFPSAKAALFDSFYQNNEHLKVFQEQLNFAVSPPPHPKWVYVEETIERAVEEVMYDKKSPKQALDFAKTKIDQILKEK